MGSNPSQLPNPHYELVHRFAAAFFAISVLLSAVSLSARALPPLRPPIRPRVTALISFSAGGSGFSICPVAMSIVS